MTDPKVDLIRAATDLARDLESILHIGRRLLGDDRDIQAGANHTVTPPAANATPAPAAKPSLTARERYLITLSASALGCRSIREWMAAGISWDVWRDGMKVECLSGTREDWYAHLAAEKFGPAPAAEAAPQPSADPHLTTRELWLMTRAYLAGKGPESHRRCGEWLRSRSDIPDLVNGGSSSGTAAQFLAEWAARTYGEPGQTPEAS